MARPLRICFEGAYYHIVNRGQGKRDIFLNSKDYESFIKTLKESCITYHVSIVAYCLMGNHYHLLVHTPNANLSKFMRQLNGVYTQVFNKRYKHDGPLFKGRYKSLVVQEGSYLLRLIRYVHKNPVRAGIAGSCCEYLYSSHKSFSEMKENEWLKFKYALRTQWKRSQNFKRAYMDFMNKKDAELEEYLNEKSTKATHAIILGDEEYMDEIKMTYLHSNRVYDEIPLGRRIETELKIEEIKKEVKKMFKTDENNFMVSIRGKENTARMMAIGLTRECCGIPYKTIGRMFGGLRYKSAAKYCERVKKKCESDKKFLGQYEKLKARCSQSRLTPHFGA